MPTAGMGRAPTWSSVPGSAEEHDGQGGQVRARVAPSVVRPVLDERFTGVQGPFDSFDAEIRKIVCTTNAIWVFGSRGRSGALLPRPTLKAASPDSERY